MPKARTIRGREVVRGDYVCAPDGDSDSVQRVAQVFGDGLVKFCGDSYHRYGAGYMRHVYDDEWPCDEMLATPGYEGPWGLPPLEEDYSK
jgi:hypothetical protein